MPRFDLTQVEECRRRFAEVFAQGTDEEKRAFARLFVQKIEVDPGTGEVLMHLFSRPPVAMSRGGHKRTPASGETGVQIGMVAGARYAALEKTRSRRWTWEVPFDTLGRALDTFWEEAMLRLSFLARPGDPS